MEGVRVVASLRAVVDDILRLPKGKGNLEEIGVSESDADSDSGWLAGLRSNARYGKC